MKYLFLLCILSCSAPPIPEWNGKLYVGNSTSRALERRQDNESIPSDSPVFDDMIAMSSDDFRSFYSTYVLGCSEWKVGTKLSTRPYGNNMDASTKVMNGE